MFSDLSTSISEISALIQSGKGHAARDAIRSIFRKQKPPRRYLADLAQLCWRSNLADLGLRVLHPIVYPNERAYTEATPKEISEYAVCLIKEGGNDEGLFLLKDIKPNLYPPSLLYSAFGHIARWDYAGSIPLLNQYIAEPSLTPYQRLVADVNLVAAYIFTSDYTSAQTLLDARLEKTSGPNLGLARSRLLQLKAESLIAKGQLDAADSCLAESDACLTDKGSIDYFFIRKYQTVVRFLRAPQNGLALLGEIRIEAQKIRHWETVRDIERLEALHTGDTNRLNKIWFGSPHPAFREALLKQKPASMEILSVYDWTPEPFTHENAPVLDIGEAMWNGMPLNEFKAGMGNHRLICALCSDFFRPFRIPTLFSILFPGERFIPRHSAMRLRKTIFRLRHWLKRYGIPLEVLDNKDGYRIRSTGPIRIRLKPETKATYRVNELLTKLSQLIPNDKPFTSVEAAEKLGISQRMAQRLLGHSLYTQHLSKTGQGKSTTYRFLST